MDKVRGTAKATPDRHEAARQLDSDLWYYYVERSQVVEPFRSAVRVEGSQRTSMKNLAEYWLRIWTPQPTKNRRVRTYDEM